MTTLRLSKHHGLGNDFLVLLDQGGDARLAARLCDRRTGVGADGLLLGTTGGPDQADLTMVLHNADGSRAEMSGNGIRCLAQAWVCVAGPSGRPLRIATDAGIRTVAVETTDDPAVVVAHVDMGKALPGPDPAGAVPAGIARSATVDIGNPHLVLLVDDIDRPDVDVEGPAIEAHFAEGINVEWIVPAAGGDRLDLRVWERGAGHTMACGTGACAAAHAAHQWGLVGERVTVVMEGGEVAVALGDPVTLIGPATHVADVQVERVTDSHRSAFGEHGGESGGFIERTFRERIVLAGVTLPPDTEEDTEAGLDELAALVDTAGADVVDRVVQRRQTPDPATFIGKGKAGELRDAAEAADCDTVVFDDELSPAQQRNLEKILGRTAIDRTAVILDIFGQNASSQEGKAQVELALLRYELPRLRRGRTASLSQQRGGGAARFGGGETKLEVDRRRIVRRIHKLEDELRDVAAHRATQRKQARRSRAQSVAIVGYTNAGKSTLLNRLTDSGVLVEDRLFATLDATTRRLQLPGGEAVLLTDTVGFVRKLPHQLVEAFRSTLQVAADADLLVHVVDASAADPVAQMHTVRDVLVEIGAADVPELLCFNKADEAPEAKRLADRHPGSVRISALTGEGIDDLLVAIGDRLRSQTSLVELHVPYARGDVLAEVHREGEVLSETAGPDGVLVRARLDEAGASRLRAWSQPSE